jgi:hypothetical protein
MVDNKLRADLAKLVNDWMIDRGGETNTDMALALADLAGAHLGVEAARGIDPPNVEAFINDRLPEMTEEMRRSAQRMIQGMAKPDG